MFSTPYPPKLSSNQENFSDPTYHCSPSAPMQPNLILTSPLPTYLIRIFHLRIQTFLLSPSPRKAEFSMTPQNFDDRSCYLSFFCSDRSSLHYRSGLHQPRFAFSSLRTAPQCHKGISGSLQYDSINATFSSPPTHASPATHATYATHPLRCIFISQDQLFAHFVTYPSLHTLILLMLMQ